MDDKRWVYLSTAITNAVCLALGVVSGILSARLLGVQGRGELAILSYYPALMAAVVSLSFPQALSFLILRDLPGSAAVAGGGVRFAAIVGMLGAGAFALLAPYTLSAESQHLSKEVSITCAASASMVINTYLYAMHRSYGRFDWVNGCLILVAMGQVALIGLLWGLGNLTAYSIVVGSLVLQLTVTAAGLWRVGIPTLARGAGREGYAEFIAVGLRFSLPMVAIMLYSVADRAILIRATSIEQIGYYAVAFSIAFPLSLLSETFAQLGFLEAAASKTKDQSLSLVLRRFQMVQVFIVGLAVIAFVLVEPFLIFGFGSKFAPALTATYLLVCAMALRGLSKTLESGLRGANQVFPGTASGLLALAGLMGLGMILTPKAGATGLAYALVGSESVGLCVLLLCTLRQPGVTPGQLWGLRGEIVLTLVSGLVGRSQRSR